MTPAPQYLFAVATAPTKDPAAILHNAISRHFATPGWIVFHEFRFSTGYSEYAQRTMDAFIIHAYPSKRHKRIVFEVKVSRSDFKREMDKPLKRKPALYLSNEFYFLTPPDLLPAAIIPPEAGLIEATETTWRVIVPAPQRDSYPPPWGMVASLARRVIEDRQAKDHQVESLRRAVKGGDENIIHAAVMDLLREPL